jgi:UDP-2,3-diacylglucosamine hydrolase
MRAVFFSDVHLDKDDKDGEFRVEEFLRNICGGADVVVILGDLFEFYHGYDGYIFPWYERTAEAIRKMTGRGTTVYFLEGNHEFGMGGYFGTHTGAQCMKDLTLDIEGKKVYLSHGEEVDRFCVGTMLKTRFVYAVMDTFGPRLTWKTAMFLRLFLSKGDREYREDVRDLFRDYAETKFSEGFDTVILAHSHMSDRFENAVQGQTRVYLNTGDFAAESTYVEYETGRGFQVKRFTL